MSESQTIFENKRIRQEGFKLEFARRQIRLIESVRISFQLGKRKINISNGFWCHLNAICNNPR